MGAARAQAVHGNVHALPLVARARQGAQHLLQGALQAVGTLVEAELAVAAVALKTRCAFLLRRVEPTIEGTWGSLVGFRLNAQFAGDSATINDAYIDLKFDPRATLRVGKAKTPVGLERLQSSSSTEAIELGFPSELAPGRDIGVQLQGDFPAGVGYALGVFNGTPDGRDGVPARHDRLDPRPGAVED